MGEHKLEENALRKYMHFLGRELCFTTLLMYKIRRDLITYDVIVTNSIFCLVFSFVDSDCQMVNIFLPIKVTMNSHRCLLEDRCAMFGLPNVGTCNIISNLAVYYWKQEIDIIIAVSRLAYFYHYSVKAKPEPSFYFLLI
jgi:hypothetical protein